ncbi:hypothetical protein M3E72_004250 [Micrococcus luteus]|nr:hypothetical protein [Micrococcus luteus]
MTANHSRHTAAAADRQGAAAEHAGTATTDPRRDTRSRWGRSSRLGGGSGRVILVSLVAGVVIALLIGAAAYGLASSQGDADPRFPAVMGAVMAASALPVGAALAWLALVDRTTVRGPSETPRRPSRAGGSRRRSPARSATCSWCWAWARSSSP